MSCLCVMRRWVATMVCGVGAMHARCYSMSVMHEMSCDVRVHAGMLAVGVMSGCGMLYVCQRVMGYGLCVVRRLAGLQRGNAMLVSTAGRAGYVCCGATMRVMSCVCAGGCVLRRGSMVGYECMLMHGYDGAGQLCHVCYGCQGCTGCRRMTMLCNGQHAASGYAATGYVARCHATSSGLQGTAQGRRRQGM